MPLATPRGLGIELRVYNRRPRCKAENRARAAGFTVLAGSMDKPHGLRECMILDDEGYLWVPSVHLSGLIQEGARQAVRFAARFAQQRKARSRARAVMSPSTSPWLRMHVGAIL